ncbi:hypothetical protein PGT21_007072 [Puccinia graminis f. sp. tritici]|uniref:No apical meristem-associated C-terminal domain-containing protein n=1 Tax=Puccinia graminis f. sp. tritici TaxID=56615 RepID=A0A5B0MEC2_PUCGR|nr:hypothetical protein PGT21_007072 [Puccinia graminis f. sp. tritici]
MDNERIKDENDSIDPDLDPTATKKKKAPNYTKPEDFELCRAWICISEDPAVGTHQDRNTFWQRVTTAYHEAIPTPI